MSPVVEALRDLLAGTGLELVRTAEPEISSWFGRFRAQAKELASSEEVARRLQKVEHAIEVATLRKPMSEENVNQADAASRLLQALNAVDNAVLLVGSMIVVKVTNADGTADVFAKTLSVAEVRAFETNQHLLKNPREALDRLHLLSAAEEG